MLVTAGAQVNYLVAQGHKVLNVDIAPLDAPGVNTTLADLTDGAETFNALSMHFGFEDLRRRLGVISPRVLSQKLKAMESGRLVRRTLIDSRPPGVRYSLTEKGVTVARLGTPVFLFLNLDKQPA